MVDVSRGISAAADYIDSLRDVWLAIITAQELIVGARDKRDAAAIDGLVANFPIAQVNDRIGNLAYGLLKKYAKSHGLRTFDSWIAATAIESSLTLVSRNRQHFEMIQEVSLQIPVY